MTIASKCACWKCTYSLFVCFLCAFSLVSLMYVVRVYVEARGVHLRVSVCTGYVSVCICVCHCVSVCVFVLTSLSSQSHRLHNRRGRGIEISAAGKVGLRE